MSYKPLEELLPRAGWSVYSLVRMAANRALEISEGKPSLIKGDPNAKPTTIALDEIHAGKVVLKSVESQGKTDKSRVSVEPIEETV